MLWKVTGTCPNYDQIKIVYGTDSNPEYPEDNKPYASDGYSASIQDLSSGTYYVRAVLIDIDEKVKLYSQQLVADIY